MKRYQERPMGVLVSSWHKRPTLQLAPPPSRGHWWVSSWPSLPGTSDWEWGNHVCSCEEDMLEPGQLNDWLICKKVLPVVKANVFSSSFQVYRRSIIKQTIPQAANPEFLCFNLKNSSRVNWDSGTGTFTQSLFCISLFVWWVSSDHDEWLWIIQCQDRWITWSLCLH